MTKSHEHFREEDDLNDIDYIYQKLLESSKIPEECFGLEDDEYYQKLIEEADLLENTKKKN